VIGVWSTSAATAEEALMKHVSRDLVDHGRTTGRYADESGQYAKRMPGLVVVAAAVLAFVVCTTNFAFGEAKAGIDAAIVGLLAWGPAWIGLSWTAGECARPKGNRSSAIPRGSRLRATGVQRDCSPTCAHRIARLWRRPFRSAR